PLDVHLGQHPSIWRDVLNGHAGQGEDPAQPAGAAHRPQRTILRSRSDGAEPQIATLAGPRQTVRDLPPGRERRLLARQIDRANGATVIPPLGVIQKSNAISLRRKTNVTDRSAGLVKHVADRVFQLIAAFHMVYGGELSRGTPVCPDYIL